MPLTRAQPTADDLKAEVRRLAEKGRARGWLKGSPRTATCAVCGGARWVEGKSGAWIPCGACSGSLVDRKLRIAGVPAKEAAYTWEGCNPHQKEAYRHVQTWLRAGASVLITGLNGRGKSAIAVLAMRRLLRDDLERSVRYLYAATFLQELRDTYSKRQRAERAGHEVMTEAEVLDRYLRPSVLLLDDLGQEDVTPWARSMTSMLLHQRLVRQVAPEAEPTQGEGARLFSRPTQTIVTSNLPLSEQQAREAWQRLPAPRPKEPSPSVEGLYGSAVHSRLLEYKHVAMPADAPERREEHRKGGGR